MCVCVCRCMSKGAYVCMSRRMLCKCVGGGACLHTNVYVCVNNCMCALVYELKMCAGVCV